MASNPFPNESTLFVPERYHCGSKRINCYKINCHMVGCLYLSLGYKYIHTVFLSKKPSKNSFRSKKVSQLSKFQVLADGNSKVAGMFKVIFHRKENVLGKGENFVTSVFSLTQNVFKRLLSQGSKNSGL